MEQLYKNIKARRVELGLTQQELAEKMGLYAELHVSYETTLPGSAAAALLNA